MFINCPNCAALVATDLATDLPPERCPRCGIALRGPVAATQPNETAPARPPPPPETSTEPPSPPAPPASAPVRTPTPTPPVPAPQPPADATSPPSAPFVALKPARSAPSADGALGANRGASAEGAPAAAEVAAAGTAATDASSAHAPAPVDPPAPQSPPPPSPPPPSEPPPGAAAPVPDSAPAVAARPEPSFAQRRRRAGHAVRRRWPALALIAALSLLLALLLMLADRERLAADAQWRPVLSRVCGALGCSLPPWREPGAIALLHRDVRPHPTQPGVLRVTATIRNDARWSQEWPRLRLRLTDIDGRALGERHFLAHEYLATAPTPGGMSAGQRASIRMDVLDPSPRTVAFDFEFH